MLINSLINISLSLINRYIKDVDELAQVLPHPFTLACNVREMQQQC